MQEIWKDIEGFNGYQVSNLGNIKSIKLIKGIKWFILLQMMVLENHVKYID